MNGPRTLPLDYDVYEIAYLAGGPCRAVDAAVVALAESGRVAVDRSTGHLSVADERQDHELEAAVLDAIGHRRYRTMETLRRRVKDDEGLAGVRRRLQGDGLLRRSASGLGRNPTWWGLALTGAGRRALRDLRAEPAAEGTDALRVALGGAAAMRDPSLRSALFDPPAPPRLPSTRRLRREAQDARFGLSTSAAAATFWVAGSENAGWGGGGAEWFGGGGGGGWGGDGGGGGGDGGG